METPIEFKGILSNKAAENPGFYLKNPYRKQKMWCGGTLIGWLSCCADFYNWNKAVVRYCDGASFSGDSENKVSLKPYKHLFAFDWLYISLVI